MSLLGSLVLEDCLGIDEVMMADGSHVSYTRSLPDAVQAVVNGEAQAAFLLGRPSVAEVESRLFGRAGHAAEVHLLFSKAAFGFDHARSARPGGA